jgi:hypothetical protein
MHGMGTLRELAKRVPGLPPVYRALHRVLQRGKARFRSRPKTTEQVFTEVYRSKAWGGKDSVSGAGSDIEQTRIIIGELTVLIKDLHISTMLDIPCGDFHWMKHVDLSTVDYTGADIVKELIHENAAKCGARNVRFRRLNLIRDELPQVDLIVCRDCLVHFSFADIFSSLGNICGSQSRYMLATTFASRSGNADISTGRWRPLNLEAAPFMLPRPLRLIYEGCTENDGAYEDKALGLWSIADIRGSLSGRGGPRRAN